MSMSTGPVGTPSWQTPMASPNDQGLSGDAQTSGVTVKLMRLKVLYTFDDQNKTNCLARWPQVLEIQTVAMDENTTIGVVELKTCIQAIVQCSPELVAKLGQDYTVYAYDYSEYDIPMVGQGMLSWALAAASPTPEAPASQSRQLITGRVCKNIQGLFSNGVAETLEVKLRLVPVPTVLQSEYVSSMEKYRELSKIMPTGFDHNEWFTFLQSNPNVAQLANRVNTPVPPPTTNQRNGVSMELVNQLLSPSLQPASIDPFSIPSSNELNGDTSRASSPGGGGRKTAQKTSRPSSRASVKRPRQSRKAQIPDSGNTSGYEEGTDVDDGPNTKKRAKITKTDWKSKASFGTASDSLRVAASTAGSIRLFRPIAVAHSGAGHGNGSHLQEVPREPTPVPSLPPQPRERQKSQSILRRDSITSQFTDAPRQYNSPYAPSETGQDSQDQIRMSIESAMTSPEKADSPADTPPDIASSPPMIRTAGNSSRSSPHVPSSPVLPQMPRTDSGFMSGDLDDLFEEEEGTRPVEDLNIAAKYNRRRNVKAPLHHGFAIEVVTPGPPELLPTKILPRTKKPEPKPKAAPCLVRSNSTMSDDLQGRGRNRYNKDSLPTSTLHEQTLANASLPSGTNGSHYNSPFGGPESLPQHQVPAATEETPLQAPTASQRTYNGFSRSLSAGSVLMPSIPASDPVLPPTSLQRCQTWSDAPHPATEAPNGITVTRATEHRRSALGKKQSIRRRLEDAIAMGEMPPFCNNCGAIETPTWRKAWAQECEGDPGYHEYSDEVGRVTAVEILKRDHTGKPTTYRLIKKSLAADDVKTAFTEITLCNPCGIWMSKYKSQRPEDRWQKDQTREGSQPSEKKGAEKKKRERSTRAKKGQTNNVLPTSEANFYSDAPGPAECDYPTENNFQQHQVAPTAAQQGQPAQMRAESVRPAPSATGMTSQIASAALRRAIQSSPARWIGTRQSPIELEDDLGTTRRLLFPSPRKDGSPKTLEELSVNVAVSPTDFRSPTSRKSIETSNKENRPPPLDFNGTDDDILKLFEEELIQPSRPTTPVQKTPPANLFKTPTRPTPNHRPITRSISRSGKSTGRQMLPQRTPSKTPSTTRRSPRHNKIVPESPFTATLNQLLSEAVDENDPRNLSPSRNLELGLDFNALPGYNNAGHHLFGNPRYDAGHDFFSTDAPMPSSPPRLNFNLYEDPMTMDMHTFDAMDEAMWDDFAREEAGLPGLGELVVDANGRATFEGPRIPELFVDERRIKVEEGADNEMGNGNGAENK